MQKPQCVRIEIPGDYIYISPIRAFIKRLAQNLKFSPTKVEDIGLALDEVCNNAIEHGSCGNKSNIVVFLILSDDCLEILVRDFGKCKRRINWLLSGRLEEVEKVMSPERERGHGIYLVKKLSDKVDMKPNTYGGTDVHMFFFKQSYKRD
jgi:anti-sigma regulatory factor (Ser/Thr protein kinase)